MTQFQSTLPGYSTSTYNMLYSTYLGGSNRDGIYGMTMDSTGLIVVTGRTEWFDFPMTAGGPPSSTTARRDPSLAMRPMS